VIALPAGETDNILSSPLWEEVWAGRQPSDVFELTRYVNDVNRGNAEVIVEYGTSGNARTSYTYGIGRLSASNAAWAGVPWASGEGYAPLTGLQYLRARYYAPESGRFLSADTYLGDILAFFPPALAGNGKTDTVDCIAAKAAQSSLPFSRRFSGNVKTDSGGVRGTTELKLLYLCQRSEQSDRRSERSERCLFSPRFSADGKTDSAASKATGGVSGANVDLRTLTR
jgi:RHS repeat-associated protein